MLNLNSLSPEHSLRQPSGLSEVVRRLIIASDAPELPLVNLNGDELSWLYPGLRTNNENRLARWARQRIFSRWLTGLTKASNEKNPDFPKLLFAVATVPADFVDNRGKQLSFTSKNVPEEASRMLRCAEIYEFELVQAMQEYLDEQFPDNHPQHNQAQEAVQVLSDLYFVN